RRPAGPHWARQRGVRPPAGGRLHAAAAGHARGAAVTWGDPPTGGRRPLLTLALAGVVTLLALGGISRLRIETSLGAMLDPDQPVVRATETIGARFAAGHELLIVLWPGDYSSAEARAAAAERIAAGFRQADEASLIADIRIKIGRAHV